MKKSSPPAPRERLYRLLLCAYPRRFREDFQEAMLGHFGEAAERAAARNERLRFWWFISRDLLVSAAAERYQSWSAKRKSRPRTRPTPISPRNKGNPMDSIWNDLRYSLRRLAKTPMFSFSVIGIVALAIGVNSVIFTLVNSILFRTPPFERSEELVDIYQDSDDGEVGSTSFPAYRDMTAYADLFTGVTASFGGASSLERDDGLQMVLVEYVTASYFEVHGLSPSVGRTFEPSEDRPGAGAAAIVSHASWRSKFGSDPDIVGRVTRLNGAPVTIVGVGPPGLTGWTSGMVTDFWLSISSLATAASRPGAVRTLDRRQDHWFMVRARLKPGVSLEQARAGMDGLARRLGRENPELNEGRRISVFPTDAVTIHPMIDGFLYPAAAALMALVGLVLVVACGNLANLFLVRGAARGREVAIRLAMGANRRRLIRQLLSESLLISLAGGVVGLLSARWLLRWLLSIETPLPLPLAFDVTLDYRVVGFTLGLALLTGLAFGLMPALRASRASLVNRLRDATESRRQHRLLSLRNGLVMMQVAVSFVLLTGAGLFTRSLIGASTIDVGFEQDRVLAILTDLSQAGYRDRRADAVYERILEKLGAVAEVERITLTSQLPLTAFGPSSTLVIEGYESSSGTGAVEVDRSAVGPDYFEIFSIPILHGRSFDGTDRAGSRSVAVVSESMARTYWGGSDAVGERFRFQADPDSWVEVVGVAADAKVRRLGETTSSLFYLPFAQQGGLRSFIVAGTAGEPGRVIPLLRSELAEIDPALPVLRAQTIEQHMAASFFAPRVSALLLAACSMLALLIASIGLNGVVAFTVSQRTSEMGIRMALGARSRQIVAMVLRETLTVVAIGALVGLGLAILVTRPLGGFLYNVSALDPLTYLLVPLVFLAVTLAATLVPARRAAGLDPVRALRYE